MHKRKDSPKDPLRGDRVLVMVVVLAVAFCLAEVNPAPGQSVKKIERKEVIKNGTIFNCCGPGLSYLRFATFAFCRISSKN